MTTLSLSPGIVSFERDGNIFITSLSTLLSSIAEGDGDFTTPILPSSCRYMSSVNGSIVLLLEQPAGVYEYNHYGEHLRIPFPNLLYLLVLRREQSTGFYVCARTQLFATVKPVSTLKEYTYRYPFSNVGDDGHICWGNIPLPYLSIVVADHVMTLFMSGKSNNDLAEEKTKGELIEVETDGTCADLVRHLHDNKLTSFPNKIMKRGRYISTILNELERNLLQGIQI